MDKSETVGALAAALAKAQGQMGAAIKDASNPFFKSKYADLAAVIAAIKAPLASNELAYVQATDIDESGGVIVETVLMHSSGEWLSSCLRMTPTKQDPQGVGSCITYARRYGLQALIGVPADDDDGNAATGADREIEVNKGNPVAETTKGRPTAKDMRDKAQQQVAVEPGAMPDKPGEIVAWFNAVVGTEPARTWDVETHAAAAKKLAITLKEAGIGDQQRRLVYLALTGHDHGGDMTPQQMVALSRTIAKPQQLLGLARWYTERNSQRDPAEGG